MQLKTLIDYLDSFLKITDFEDYALNGLQVESKSEIKKIITGVSISQPLIEEAINLKADVILVHHGLFWHKDNISITGLKKKRLAHLLANNINLLAYHLPLDAHPKYGNNAQLAKFLNIKSNTDFSHAIFRTGYFTKGITGQILQEKLTKLLNRIPFYIEGRAKKIERVAWCSGGGQKFIEKAYKENVDAFITGEVSQDTVIFARESKIHFYAAGHHATERFGVKALGEHLAKKFKIEQIFIDIDNPI